MGWSNIFGLRFAADANLSLLWLNSAVWASTASRIALVAFVFLLAIKTGLKSGLIVAGKIEVAVVPSSWITSIDDANKIE